VCASASVVVTGKGYKGHASAKSDRYLEPALELVQVGQLCDRARDHARARHSVLVLRIVAVVRVQLEQAI